MVPGGKGGKGGGGSGSGRIPGERESQPLPQESARKPPSLSFSLFSFRLRFLLSLTSRFVFASCSLSICFLSFSLSFSLRFRSRMVSLSGAKPPVVPPKRPGGRSLRLGLRLLFLFTCLARPMVKPIAHTLDFLQTLLRSSSDRSAAPSRKAFAI